mmetsp:Transcript_48119/g.80963  ORF Transcript_48119/g.80963 Transcript_48119/m.80963 type:complete len:215 (+) Transcript_48119:298-942(+)
MYCVRKSAAPITWMGVSSQVTRMSVLPLTCLRTVAPAASAAFKSSVFLRPVPINTTCLPASCPSPSVLAPTASADHWAPGRGLWTHVLRRSVASRPRPSRLPTAVRHGKGGARANSVVAVPDRGARGAACEADWNLGAAEEGAAWLRMVLRGTACGAAAREPVVGGAHATAGCPWMTAIVEVDRAARACETATHPPMSPSTIMARDLGLRDDSL